MEVIDPTFIVGGMDISSIQLPEISLGEVGCVLLAAGVSAIVYQLVRGWIKRKGFRMVLRDRNDKKHALWLEIITDGIENAVVKGLISSKEANEMYADAQKSMGLNDLVPKKRLLKMVKEDIKRARVKRGLPPIPVVKKKFSERLGKTAGKFFRQRDVA